MWRTAGDTVIFIAAVLSALALIVRTIRSAVRAASDRFRDEVKEIVHEQLQPFREELKANGGSSVKDIAISTNRRVEEITRQLEELAVLKRCPEIEGAG